VRMTLLRIPTDVGTGQLISVGLNMEPRGGSEINRLYYLPFIPSISDILNRTFDELLDIYIIYNWEPDIKPGPTS